MRELGHQYTMAELKDELPCVSVLHNGRHFIGRILGRMNQFATIDVRPTDDNIITAEFSWQSVLRAKNGQRSLSL